MSFRDKVEGNELDLSLNELTEVPVKELAATPKATHLDLSCNLIQSLPNDFASLTHLVKIDLSRNKISELPHNFGNLLNLQFLDLDRNELKTVPLSFCRLKNLRWLDLKDNPLEPKFKAVAGDCLDEKECQACAKKVVAYMQSIESNLEREKQKKLKEIREKEAVEKAKMEKELEEQRRLKKLQKERRKAESKARNEEKLRQNKQNLEKDSSQSDTESKDAYESLQEKNGINWLKGFLILFCIAVGFAAYILATAKDIRWYKITTADIKPFAEECLLKITEAVSNLWKFIIPHVIYWRVFILRNVHSFMICVSNFATDVETMLSVYF